MLEIQHSSYCLQKTRNSFYWVHVKCDGGACVHCFAKSQGKDRTKHPPLLKSWLLSLGWCLFSGQESHLVMGLQMCAWALAACGKLPLPTHSPCCWDIQASRTQMCTCVLCQCLLLVLLTLTSFPLWLGSQVTCMSSSLICCWFSVFTRYLNLLCRSVFWDDSDIICRISP